MEGERPFYLGGRHAGGAGMGAVGVCRRLGMQEWNVWYVACPHTRALLSAETTLFDNRVYHASISIRISLHPGL